MYQLAHSTLTDAESVTPPVTEQPLYLDLPRGPTGFFLKRPFLKASLIAASRLGICSPKRLIVSVLLASRPLRARRLNSMTFIISFFSRLDQWRWEKFFSQLAQQNRDTQNTWMYAIKSLPTPIVSFLKQLHGGHFDILSIYIFMYLKIVENAYLLAYIYRLQVPEV